jgi:hypothetical protein
MNFNPEDITEQVREAHWERVRKDYNRAVNGNRLFRYFRACRWRHHSNEIYRGLIDAFVIFGPLGGLLIAMVIGIAIVQYFKPWL